MRQAVFLDRDGVLNQIVRRDDEIASPRDQSEFQLFPYVGECVRRLKEAGFTVVVVTNQPDISRGTLAPSELETMHQRLRAAAPVDEVLHCPHDDADNCACRKPKPGMLTDAAEKLGLDLGRSYMVGDSYKDMQAAKTAGVVGILVEAEYNRGVAADHRARDLIAACDYILAKGHR